MHKMAMIWSAQKVQTNKNIIIKFSFSNPSIWNKTKLNRITILFTYQILLNTGKIYNKNEIDFSFIKRVQDMTTTHRISRNSWFFSLIKGEINSNTDYTDLFSDTDILRSQIVV